MTNVIINLSPLDTAGLNKCDIANVSKIFIILVDKNYSCLTPGFL